MRKYHVQHWVQKNLPKLEHYAKNLSKPALSLGKGALSLLFALFAIFILVLLLLLEGPKLGTGLLADDGARRAPPVSAASPARCSRSVTGYMLGNFITSIIAGIVVFVTLVILGVPYALLWALWVALVDFLPMIGGALAGIPTVLFAFIHSVTAGVVTLVVFLVYTQVENHILNPIVMSRTVRINPLLVLMAMLVGANLGDLVGGFFGGFVGTLLAIPVAGSIQVIVREVWQSTAPEAQLEVVGGGGRTRARSPKLPPVRTLVVLPTYNEAENIDRVLRRIRAAMPDAGVLVVDDGSPDGTADMAEKLGVELGRIDVLRRPSKVGPRQRLPGRVRLGPRAGLGRLRRDGRRPVARARSAARRWSRRSPRASTSWWGRATSRAGRSRTGTGTAGCCRRAATSTPAFMLGLHVTTPRRDSAPTGRDVLRRIDLGQVRAEGYGFQIEMVHQVVEHGGRVTEVPIRFVDRVEGKSKMSMSIVVEALLLVTWWAILALPARMPAAAAAVRCAPGSLA